MKYAVLILLLPICASAYTKRSFMVEMRDGIALHTNVYAPSDTTDLPHPVVLMRTPYCADLIDLLVFYLFDAADLRRYIVVAQDVRGRFGSEGIDSVFFDDGWRNGKWDGYDTVEWIAAQPWCDGRVGMVGESAVGITQYLAAGALPPHLVCAAPRVAAWDFYSTALMVGGEYRENDIDGWLQGQGTLYMRDFYFQHPNKDETWQWLDISTQRDSIGIPMFHIGGWYDVFSRGPVSGFVDLQYHGAIGAHGTQQLMMGPWTHATGGTVSGEITYPSNASVDLTLAIWDWFDFWLKGEANGVDALPAVRYYVMGPVEESGAWNEWRGAWSWPVPCDTVGYHLHPDGSLALAPPASEGSLSIVYDPADPVPTVGGNNLFAPRGPYDQTDAAWYREDVLVFQSPPLEEPVTVVGDIHARLYVSSDRYDTDFTVKLVDHYPDGRRMLVQDGILMARHRNGLETEELLVPGTIYEIGVELWATAYAFAPGHRIAIAVSNSNYPRFRANPNVPEPLGADTYALVAANRVYFGPSHPSAVLLPVVSGQPAARPPDEKAVAPLLWSNPFRGAARLVVLLDGPSPVSVGVYDLGGRETLHSHTFGGSPGLNSVWLGDELAPGAYVIIVQAGDSFQTIRAVKIK